MSQSKVNVSIVGASGYAGMEAVRLILQHPAVQLNHLYGNQSAGKTLSELYPSLEHLADQTLLPMDDLKKDDSDVLLFGLPHGSSAEPIATLIEGGFKGKIIDMGSDYRLKNPDDYQTFYHYSHPHPSLLPDFTYGLPEFFKSKIATSNYVASPGCFATTIQLAILPLIEKDCSSSYYITAVTGSSGSGVRASSAVHFSHRFGNMKAYKVLNHQHMGEIKQSVHGLTNENPEILFTPVSGPYVRGIWLTASFSMNSENNISEIFQNRYSDQPFIRLRNNLPELKHVVGSNFVDIGWQQNGKSVVVVAALDNLVKGAAGQAIQNLNIMSDIDETSGLKQSAITL